MVCLTQMTKLTCWQFIDKQSNVFETSVNLPTWSRDSCHFSRVGQYTKTFSKSTLILRQYRLKVCFQLTVQKFFIYLRNVRELLTQNSCFLLWESLLNTCCTSVDSKCSKKNCCENNVVNICKIELLKYFITVFNGFYLNIIYLRSFWGIWKVDLL